LFLNTIEPRKNLLNVIEAFENADLKAHLVIAGKKGWKTGGIFKRLKQSQKASKIRYLNYIEEERKPAIIKMAKAMLYPSFYEGFGFQALEAMSIGTPVIASQITSLPEVGSEAVLLVNPYNKRDLVLAMESIENNTQLGEKLKERGLARAQMFSWHLSANQILNYLESL